MKNKKEKTCFKKNKVSARETYSNQINTIP